jgi:1,4-alpha-glucan branching enzyme
MTVNLDVSKGGKVVKKSYSKSGRVCRVTFQLPPTVNAQTAQLCGDFNDWNTNSHPMRRSKNGGFTLTLSMETNQEYRFRYLLDGDRWENDWAADGYVPNDFGSEDSVVDV